MTMFPSTATSQQQTSWEKQIASQIIFLVIYTGCVIHTRSDCPKSILKTVSGIRDSHKWCFPHNFESTLTTTQCNQFFRKDICFSVCVGFKLPLPDTQGHKTESTKTELLTLALGRYMKTEPRRQKHPGSTINWSINKPLSVIVLFPTALHWCSLSLSQHFFGPRCAENATQMHKYETQKQQPDTINDTGMPFCQLSYIFKETLHFHVCFSLCLLASWVAALVQQD